MNLCVVCLKRCKRGLLCRACGYDYDKNATGDGSVWAAIEWAARRVRYFAHESTIQKEYAASMARFASKAEK